MLFLRKFSTRQLYKKNIRAVNAKILPALAITTNLVVAAYVGVYSKILLYLKAAAAYSRGGL